MDVFEDELQTREEAKREEETRIEAMQTGDIGDMMSQFKKEKHESATRDAPDAAEKPTEAKDVVPTAEHEEIHKTHK